MNARVPRSSSLCQFDDTSTLDVPIATARGPRVPEAPFPFGSSIAHATVTGPLWSPSFADGIAGFFAHSAKSTIPNALSLVTSSGVSEASPPTFESDVATAIVTPIPRSATLSSPSVIGCAFTSGRKISPKPFGSFRFGSSSNTKSFPGASPIAPNSSPSPTFTASRVSLITGSTATSRLPPPFTKPTNRATSSAGTGSLGPAITSSSHPGKSSFSPARKGWISRVS